MDNKGAILQTALPCIIYLNKPTDSVIRWPNLKYRKIDVVQFSINDH